MRQTFIDRLGKLLDKFKNVKPNESSLLTDHQAHLISDIEKLSSDAHTPLQKLEHALHPVVSLHYFTTICPKQCRCPYRRQYYGFILSSHFPWDYCRIVNRKVFRNCTFQQISRHS